MLCASIVGFGSGACGSSKDESPHAKMERDRAAAQSEKDRAYAARRNAEEQVQKLELEVEEFRNRLAQLGKDLDAADRDLLAAKTQAQRDAVAARQAELRLEQAKVQADIDRARAKIKPKCPPDKPLC